MSALRIVRPEILDGLPPEDPQAKRARRELRRINALMGSAGHLARALAPLPGPEPAAPLRLLELGAGDGTLTLRLARRLALRCPHAELTLLDRQCLLAPPTIAAFARLGWRVKPLRREVLAWSRSGEDARWDAIVANLFLHHFAPEHLAVLLASVAARCALFVAFEPRRAALPLAASRLLGLIGAGRVTRHDAVTSVHAGFRGRELSACWPASPGWILHEGRAGAFGHVFRACASQGS